MIISPRLRESFPFCVECKHRKNFRLEHAFLMTKDFQSYHEQVLDACAREKNTRYPMVVIRGQGGLIFAAQPFGGITNIFRLNDLRLNEGPALVTYMCAGSRWVMTDLDTMLKAIFSHKAAQTAA